MNIRSAMFLSFALTPVICIAQSVSLRFSGGEIHVGETFLVDVVVDKAVVGLDAELLSFGFNVFNSATVSFIGASVFSGFDDVSSLVPYDIAGSAFPGVTSSPLTLATLSFTGLAGSEGSISVFGPVDPFGGLKYTTFDPLGVFFIDEDFPIDATVRFPILPAASSTVPDTGTTVALLGLALTGLAIVRRRFA